MKKFLKVDDIQSTDKITTREYFINSKDIKVMEDISQYNFYKQPFGENEEFDILKNGYKTKINYSNNIIYYSKLSIEKLAKVCDIEIIVE